MEPWRTRPSSCVSRELFVYRTIQAIVSALLISVSTANAQSPEDSKPAVHLKSVHVERIDLEKAAAETSLSIQIDNPGPAFKLKDLSYRIKLNDKEAAEGRYARAITVPAHSSAKFELPCTVDLSALPGVAWGIIAGGFELRYDLETEFSVPLLPQLSPRLKTSIGGDLSLVRSVSGWTAKLKEHLSSKQ
ncbi:MAG TPA: LEA type 2 family protein [Blastocatellia bacterium]|nr:LEA type 2 family protein [Blastocatellia bacterium]